MASGRPEHLVGHSGSLVAGRFEIDRHAGSGGMGTVYRARDLHTGAWVALKLLHEDGAGEDDAGRFAREADLLAELRHPGIVAHVAHGRTDEGRCFLAMEWLEGQDLASRLQGGPLPIADCLLLLRRLAEALGTAHRHGIIHRDIKPSNLFLPDGEIARVKLIDFGIARRRNAARAVTRTGMVLGTPEYMAPEQARGVRELTPAVDVFALGCVVYQCLVGQPPFVADHVAAVLVRILFEEPPPAEARRSGIPAGLGRLLGRMLRKDPGQRPADAAALLAAIESLTDGTAGDTGDRRAPPPSFAESEQRLVSVVIAGPPASAVNPESDTLAPTTTKRSDLEPPEGLHAALLGLGVQAELLATGALVVTASQSGSATDLALLAARAALLIKEQWPGAVVSLATGRGALQGRTPVGEVVDRAAAFLSRPTQPMATPAAATGVWIDELSSRLLEGRFAQVLRPGGALLLNEEKDADASRPLLGKPTPCVGREIELGLLEGQLSGCIEEPEARAVLITAPPGIGKSRLRHELLRRVAQRGESITVLLGRGDLVTAGTPYGLLALALRRACGLFGGEPIEEQRARFTAGLLGRVAEPGRARVAELLAELCGVPFSDDSSGRLRTLRADPRALHEQIRRAFLDWLGAECAHAPVLLVLDDLQWADTLSVGLLDAALRELRDAPLCVVALARPEVREAFPRLWPGLPVQEISLKGLGRKACERLVHKVLGRDVPPEAVARLCEQSGGNALYLEELIRAWGEGQSAGQPETVVAMLQARIGRLDAGPRRAVRAASVFGATFWLGGVAAILDLEGDEAQVEAWLNALIDEEAIVPHPESRLPHETEYGFRHGLVREAAYSLLTPGDLVAGHRLAARYLELRGGTEPLLLAEHYRRGGEPAQAARLYVRAGEEASRLWALPEAREHYAAANRLLDELPDGPERRQALVDVLLRRVQLGALAVPHKENLAHLDRARGFLDELIATGGPGERSPEDQRRSIWIDLLRARLHHYQGLFKETLRYCEPLLPAVRALGDERLLALVLHTLGGARLSQGDMGQSRRWLATAVELKDKLDTDYDRLRAVSIYAIALVASGDYREGMALHQEALHQAGESQRPAGLALANLNLAASLRMCGDFAGVQRCSQRALEHSQKSGEPLLTLGSLRLNGWAHCLLGDQAAAAAANAQAQKLQQSLAVAELLGDWFEAAEAEMALLAGDVERARARAEQLVPRLRAEERFVSLGLAEQVLGLALGRAGLKDPTRERTDEADAHLAAGLAVFEASDQRMAAAILRMYWAALCRLRGDASQAVLHHERALDQLERSGCVHLLAGILTTGAALLSGGLTS